MSRRGKSLGTLAANLVLLLALALGVAAQGPRSGTAPPLGADGELSLQSPRTAAAASAVPVGEPGLSFRWVQTLGEPGVPYLADTEHINFPFGVWAGASRVWIAEGYGRRAIQFSNAGGYVSSIGTPGVQLYQDQSIDWLADVAVDAGGNVWLADAWASHVLQFDSSGAFVRELGEAWYWGNDNAHFGRPVSLAFDSAGNIYVSDGLHWWDPDTGNQRVQVFDPAGNYLTTIGQTGVAGQGNNQFYGPAHIAIRSNLLYVADSGNHRVQIFDVANPAAPAYVATIGVTGVAGSDNAHLNTPMGVAVTSSAIYVADSKNSRVQVFDRNTRAYVRTIGAGWGTGNAQFAWPSDVAVDGSLVYVADPINYRLQQFDTNGTYQRTYGVTGVPYLTDSEHYHKPQGVAVASDGSLYILEEKGQRLIKLNPDGMPLWTVGAAGVKSDWDWDNLRLDDARDVALDAAGRIYVADNCHSRVQIFGADGSYRATLDAWGSDELGCPVGVGLGANGWLYVADPCHQRVVIFDTSLSYVASLGVLDEPGADNAHFNWPADVAVASDGTIYVADPGNARVQVFNASRAYVRTMGVTGEPGEDLNHFSWPGHLMVDAANRLYVSDAGRNHVRVFDHNGAYLTTVGTGWGSGNGQMWQVGATAVDSDSTLYVADGENHRIQVFALGYPGWVQTNVEGFGRGDGGITSLISFGGNLYASTMNGYVFRAPDGKTWTEVTPAWSTAGVAREIFGSYLYYGGWAEGGGEVWRTNGTAWERVVAGGFGDSSNQSISELRAFSGALYAATHNPTTGTEVWRSTSGNPGTWSQVNQDGFGGAGTAQDHVMDVYNGHLYVALSRNGLGELWRTANGTTWQPVFTNGLGNPNNSSVSALAELSGYFYAALRNTVTGSEVWRSADGMTGWTRVVSGGLGDPRNGRPYGLIAFDGRLYLVFSKFVGAEVWRSANGTDWEKVAEGGWGNGANYFASYADKGAAVLGNRLYIGTYNSISGGQIWKKTVTADFGATPRQGTPPLTVVFTNLSAGDYSTHLWDFGDGTTSAQKSPTHTYSKPGVYTVSLTVGDGVETNTRRRSAYIRAQYPHAVYLPLVLRKR